MPVRSGAVRPQRSIRVLRNRHGRPELVEPGNSGTGGGVFPTARASGCPEEQGTCRAFCCDTRGHAVCSLTVWLRQVSVETLVDCFYSTTTQRLTLLGSSATGDMCAFDVTGEALSFLGGASGGHTQPVRCAAYMPHASGNTVVVSGGEDGVLCKWSPHASSALKPAAAPTARAAGAAGAGAGTGAGAGAGAGAGGGAPLFSGVGRAVGSSGGAAAHKQRHKKKHTGKAPSKAQQRRGAHKYSPY